MFEIRIISQRKSDLSSILGALGIGIDDVVNSSASKSLVYSVWRQRNFQDVLDAKREQMVLLADAEWIERHLGASLRKFIEVGNWIRINAWAYKLARMFGRFHI